MAKKLPFKHQSQRNWLTWAQRANMMTNSKSFYSPRFSEQPLQDTQRKGLKCIYPANTNNAQSKKGANPEQQFR